MPSIALVGDRSPSVRAHARIPQLLDALRRRDGVVLDPYWVPSTEAHSGLEDFDGVWIVPGSPYESPEGAVAAARTARTLGIPFLGTCGGFQHAVLMLARDLAGIGDATHAEYFAEGEPGVRPPGPYSQPNEPAGRGSAVVVALECSLVGHEGGIAYEPGTLMQRIMGVERSVERYHCSYGIDPAYLDRLREAGVVFSARDDAGDVRALELPDHPFFLGTLFQPELAGDGTRAHPVIRAFADACVKVPA